MSKSLIKKKEKKSLAIKITSMSTILTLLLLSMICTLIGVNYSQRIELTQLQANSNSQMMGYVITTENQKTIVIDGGTKQDSQNLEKHIQEHGNKVDYWFLTHPHKDHVGAFMELVQHSSIEIGQIYVSLNELEWYTQNEPQRQEEIKEFFTITQSDKIKDKITEVFLHQTIDTGGIKAQILGVKNPEITTNAINNSSMVIKLMVNRKSILFLGDTGIESGEKLLSREKEKLKADIVQMAHHGQSGVTEEVYQTIQPSICLWPTPQWLWHNDIGEGEDSGPWKTKETRTWMEKLNVKENIIEKDGDQTRIIW